MIEEVQYSNIWETGYCGKKKWYTVYRAVDDEVVALGTGAMCAKGLGWTLETFYSIVSKVKFGKNRAYTIVVENPKTRTYVVYGADNCRGQEKS